LNGVFGNPGGTLAGLDAPGAGGFAASLGVTHANSHDSDYAALKEMQHAHYMFREGMGLIYSDGYYKAATLGESGGAFPRHANTQFLGQFADPRIPNILKIHNDLARGLQQGRWSDGDFMAYERRDNRDKFGNTRNGIASEEITMVAMFNDNTAQGQARSFATSFAPGAYLYQYAEQFEHGWLLQIRGRTRHRHRPAGRLLCLRLAHARAFHPLAAGGGDSLSDEFVFGTA
jgi:hypothetical protein